MKKTSIEQYAKKITASWRKGWESVIETGQWLIDAKKEHGHGEFLRLFRGHERSVSEPVPFKEDNAEKFMAVAAHPVLSNSAHVRNLPPAFSTLYELTKLDDEQIVAGIKAGEITPDMTRADASALRADPIEKPEQPPHEEMAAAVKNAVTKFVGRLTTPEQFLYVRRRLELMLEFLSEMEAEHGVRRSGKKTARASAG